MSDYLLNEGREYAEHLKANGVAGFTLVQDLVTYIESQKSLIVDLSTKRMHTINQLEARNAELQETVDVHEKTLFSLRQSIAQHNSQPQPETATARGIWFCQCGSANGGLRTTCGGCGRSKNPPTTLQVSVPVLPTNEDDEAIVEEAVRESLSKGKSRPSVPPYVVDSADARRLQSWQALNEFFDKYALGDKLPPSCFVCGQQMNGVDDVGVSHLELLTVKCCKRCKEASERASLPPTQSRPFCASCGSSDLDCLNDRDSNQKNCCDGCTHGSMRIVHEPENSLCPDAADKLCNVASEVQATDARDRRAGHPTSTKA